MSAPHLIIGGIVLPQRARLDYQQTFERVDGGGSSRRMASGSLFTSSRWQKWKTTVAGGGWVPAPLLSLPVCTSIALQSVAPIALRPGESLPAGWSQRIDVPETVLTDEHGVTVRLVYPVLNVVTILGARQTVGGASPKWEINFEEP